MAEGFKIEMAQKLAEDEKLDQMSVQKRMMRKLKHKIEIEMLWQEKLAAYRLQWDQEFEDRRPKEIEVSIQKEIIQK